MALQYEWVRGPLVTSLAGSGRLRMYVTIPAGWRTLERVITHYRVSWIDNAGDAAGPPSQGSLTYGLRWMNTGAGLPDTDPINNVTADYLWCETRPFRELYQPFYATQFIRAGIWSPENGRDVTARRTMNTIDTYRAVFITEPLPAFSDGSRPYAFDGYQEVLISRPA